MRFILFYYGNLARRVIHFQIKKKYKNVYAAELLFTIKIYP